MADDKRLQVIEAIKDLIGVGSFKANILYDAGFDSTDKLRKARIEDLLSIKGISQVAAESIFSTIQNNAGKPPAMSEAPLEEAAPVSEPVDGPAKDDEEAPAGIVWEEPEGEEEAVVAEPVEEEGDEFCEVCMGPTEKGQLTCKKCKDRGRSKGVMDALVEWSIKQQEFKRTRVRTTQSSNVDIASYNLSIYESAMEQAWVDGLITEDERAILENLRKKLGITGDQHLDIEAKIRSRSLKAQQGAQQPSGASPKSMPVTQPVPQQVHVQTQPLPRTQSAVPEARVEDDLEEDIRRLQQGKEYQKAFNMDAPDEPAVKAVGGEEKLGKPKLITLTRGARAEQGPAEFAQIKDEHVPVTNTDSASHIECPKCGSAVPVPGPQRPITVQCPNCGAKGRLEVEDKVLEADLAQLNYLSIEEILALADDAFKKTQLNKAFAYYSKVMQLDPTNKKAGFFQKKIRAMLSKKIDEKKVRVKQITSLSTGVRRFDDLTGTGGVPFKSNTLLLGPSFIGKETLMNCFIAQGMKDDQPAIVILTSKPPDDIKSALSFIVPNYIDYEKKGLIYFIDAYSATMGIFKKNTAQNVISIQDINNTDDILNNLALLQKEINDKMGPHRLVFFSLSNILTHIGVQKMLLFLQTLVARNNEYRATSIYDMAKGIHADTDITAIEYQMDGILEFKSEETRNYLKLRGMGETVKTRDWVEYKFTKKDINLVGSFTMEYIA